jgi:predicted amidohydrolase YtcJ
MHVHPYFAGIEEMGCKFASGAAPEVIKAAVKTCVDATTPGQWVEGGNWVAAVFEPGQQTRQFLDEVARLAMSNGIEL